MKDERNEENTKMKVITLGLCVFVIFSGFYYIKYERDKRTEELAAIRRKEFKEKLTQKYRNYQDGYCHSQTSNGTTLYY